MKNSISTFDFSFLPSGHGHYKVTYTCQVTGKSWTTVTNNMYLVDMVKGNIEAKKVHLNALKYLVKNN
jgi:hypothetical protein